MISVVMCRASKTLGTRYVVDELSSVGRKIENAVLAELVELARMHVCSA